MQNKYKKGAEWRRWDLHVHTKDTSKNDNFTSVNFESFCNIMFEKAIKNDIAAIGITDYFNIKNYKKVLLYINDLEANKYFDDEDKIKIREILILPNVELRVLPVTDKGRLVNFHCIFNPDYIQNLDDDFFNALDMSIGLNVYTMNDSGLTKLGLSQGATKEQAYIKGLESFVVSHEKIIDLLKKKPKLKENTITLVSNSNSDGNSAYQKHYDFFEDTDNGSLDEVRKSIYHLSDLIFSSNVNDRKYFLGKKKNAENKIIDDENVVINKCGSLKGCVHGSDAHTEDKLFSPDNDNFCWIKADPTFDGLEQILIEPEERIHIGKIPDIKKRVLDNRTKYIKQLSINSIPGYDGKYGKWFENISIELNSELVAIIGNKGSGKSAIADILALCAFYKDHDDFSFLHTDKFRMGKLAKNFQATLKWESDVETSKGLNEDNAIGELEQVKYLPQGYFERLTNEISTTAAFQKEIENVVFTHLAEEDKIGFNSFQDLIEFKKANVEREIETFTNSITNLNSQIIKLENKLNPKYKKEIENKLKQKEDELNALIEPLAVVNPSENTEASEQNKLVLNEIEKLKAEIVKIGAQINSFNIEKNVLLLELRDLKELKQEIEFKVTDIQLFKQQKKELTTKFHLDLDILISVPSNLISLTTLIADKENKLTELKEILGEEVSKTQDYKSLKISLEENQKKLQIEQNKLDTPLRLFQLYLNEKNIWIDKKNKIIGNELTQETIKYFQKEITFLNENLIIEIETLRNQRLEHSKGIFDKKQDVIKVYKDAKSKLDSIIQDNTDLLNTYKIDINAKLSFSPNYSEIFFRNFSQNQMGTFYGIESGNLEFNKIVKEIDFDTKDGVEDFLQNINNAIHEDQRDKQEKEKRYLEGQVKTPLELYNSLFSLSFLDYNYQLMQGTKKLQQLSPGERGALLLVFYLLLDKSDIPLIIDQPEDNLDNHSVANILVPFIRKAKSKRQIILVTHNPNLAVVSDAEQVIFVTIDKEDGYKFEFNSGSIENRTINECIVKVLEGAMPAFNKRKLKYYN